VTASLPDAAPANWVDRHAPAALRPWLRLARLDRPTGIWLLMLPGWQGVALAAATEGKLPSVHLLILFAVGATLMRAAGCAFNDIVDRDIDARVARTAPRPIPAGEISVRGAAVFLVACGLASLAILLSFDLLSLYLGVASLALVAAYPFMKRITWWPQAWLGLTFNWGALLGYAAALGGPPAAMLLSLVARAGIAGTDLSLVTRPLPVAAILLYASGVFWTLGYDTIYAVQDLEDDALAGVKSSARRLGANAPRAVLGFYAVSVVLLVAAGIVAGLGPVFYAAIALYGMMLGRQATRLRMDDGAAALRLFQSNTGAGLLLFAGIAAGALR
jgi:4-hydroxybenzoate polyprenyltransferase